jgi:hypothetical protein
MPNRRKTRRRHKHRKTQRSSQGGRYSASHAIQHGGRFVGSGTYGCGFRPALRCEGEDHRRRGKFAKLVHRSTAADEMVLRTILMPHDPERQYFLYPEAVCEPAPFEASDEAGKCHLKFSDDDPSRIIIMGKGGKNLQDLTLHPRDYIPFFESLRNVFRGLAILNANGLAHMDAKPPNIVTRRHADGSFHTRLIDFGLMIDPTRLDAWAAIPNGTFKQYDVLDSNYLYWPFEVRFLKPGMLDKARTQNIDIQVELGKFYRAFAAVRISVPYELFGLRRLTRPDIAALAGPLAPMATVPRYATIIEKADVHGFGVSLAQIYYRFTGHRDGGAADGPNIKVKASSPVADPAKPAAAVVPTPVAGLAPSAELSAAAIAWHQVLAERVSVPLYSLVRDMTHPQPARRPTMEQALERYEAILPRMAEELTSAAITMAIKPWMLDIDVLIEGATPAAGGAGAAAASSSSEVPPSPEAAVPAPSAPPELLAAAVMSVPLPESPAAVGVAPSPRRIVVPAPRSVLPNLAEGGSEENMISYVSSNRSSSRPYLIPQGRRVFNVSSSSESKSWDSPEMSSEELRQKYENYINSHFVKRY